MTPVKLNRNKKIKTFTLFLFYKYYTGCSFYLRRRRRRLRWLSRMESMDPPGYPVTAAVLTAAMQETPFSFLRVL